MAVTLPPVPLRSAVTDSRGLMSSPWSQWIRTAFERMGGTIAPSVSDLEDQSTAVTALEALTGTHTTQIAANSASLNDILQGPNL